MLKTVPAGYWQNGFCRKWKSYWNAKSRLAGDFV